MERKKFTEWLDRLPNKQAQALIMAEAFKGAAVSAMAFVRANCLFFHPPKPARPDLLTWMNKYS